MQIVRESICRGFLLLTSLSALLFVSSSVTAQQSVAENIRPVARICLAGQSCVGNSVGNVAGNIAQPAVRPATAVPAAAASTDSASTVSPTPASATTSAATPSPVAAVTEPAAAAFDAAATYQMSCFACHATGAAGAPLVGDKDAWSERIDNGMDVMMANVVNGINAMPPRGLCVDCSDEDLQALVDYMLEQ